MIDLAKRIYIFFFEGFEAGWFVTWEEHTKFVLIHKEEKIKIEILTCHHSANTKYHFELFINDVSKYEKMCETEKDIMIITGEINHKIYEWRENP